MLSAYTERGADATLDALERGALDFLQKPDGSGSQNIAHLADAVVEKVDELATADVSTLALARATAAVHATRNRERRPISASSASSARGATARSASTGTAKTTFGVQGDRNGSPVDVETPVSFDGTDAGDPTVIIGASTGGPKIIEHVLARFPRQIDAKIIVVQHMPNDFTGRFADRLDGLCAYDVREASDGDRVGPGEVVIARGGYHLEVKRNVGGSLRVQLSDDERLHGVRPSIDVTMHSAAEQVVDPLCGVVLTGMGRDGAEGIRAIKAAGGRTIAQDESTSPVFGIPCQAIETGCVDEVVPAPELVDRIVNAFNTDGENDD